MTRAATSGELAVYRSDGLAAKLYAFIDQPVTVYQCRVNQSFTTHDQVAEVTYDGATGTLANVLPGMTVLIGSSAGAHDKGMARVRKDWTSSIAYFGEGSEIDWEDNLYLTVIDGFAFWPRHLRVQDDGSALMDYDIAYSDQHSNFTPVPCLGPDRVLELVDEDVSTVLSASESWVPGSTISNYAWTVLRGTATLTGGTTATPTLTATAAGRILIACTVTAANGKSATGYRNIYVWDESNPPTEITLNNLSGSFESGGFEFSFQYPLSPGFTPINFTKVVLFADEYPQPIGPVTGAENILAIGWMDEQSCIVDEKGGEATISAKGAHYWLSKIFTYPSGIANTNSAPAAWTEIQNLTVDKMLHHFLTWRSTFSNCADWFPSNDTRIAPSLQTTDGNLWSGIATLAGKSILATAACDPYSRLFIQVDSNFLPVADRSGIPTVISLTSDDFERVDFVFRPAPNVCQVDLSGVSASGLSFFSLAPGRVYGRFGQPLPVDKLLLDDQEQANELAGLMLGREQRLFDFDISLVSPIRLFTIAPRQYLQLSISANDTPAGISYSGKAIPREIVLEHNDGVLSMRLACEPETFPTPSIATQPPLAGNIEAPPFPPPPPLPPVVPPIPEQDPYKLKMLYVLTEDQETMAQRVFACPNVFGSPKVWTEITPDDDPEFVPEHFVVEWVTGALYAHDGTNIYRSYPTYSNGIWYPGRMYKFIYGTSLFVGGNPANNTIESIGINEITGEMVVMVSNTGTASERHIFIGSIESLESAGSMGSYSIWSVPMMTIGNGRVIIGWMASTIGSTFLVSEDGGANWVSTNTTTFAGEAAFPARAWHIRPNPVGDEVIHFASKGAVDIALSTDLCDNSEQLDDESIALDLEPSSICTDPERTVVFGAQRASPYRLYRSLNGGETWELAPVVIENNFQVIWAGVSETGDNLFILFRALDGLGDLTYSDDNFATETSIGAELVALLGEDEIIKRIRAFV